MAIERTGSVYELQSNATITSLSVTVPADADICIVVCGYYFSPDKDLNKLNWDNDAGVIDFTNIDTYQAGGSDNAVSVYYMKSSDGNWPGSGSKTLYRGHPSTPTGGSILICFFYKNVDISGDPIVDNERGSKSGAGSGTMENSAMTVSGDDMSVFAGVSYSVNPNPVPSGYGQTQVHDSTLYNGVYLAACEELGEDVLRIETVDYASGIAFALLAEAGTTAVPTTAVPTTLAPTTLAPTTLAPTTLAPTTEAPTTIPPTTEPPTTAAPTTEAPTSPPPTTAAPTTLAPTTEAPTTAVPTTAAPTTIYPSTYPPSTAPATTLAPTTAAPTTLAPTTRPPCWWDDDFTGNNGDPPYPCKWNDISNGDGSIEIQGNKLRAEVTGGAGNGIARLRKELSGDFSVQVDWDKISSITQNYWTIGLWLYDQTNGYYFIIERHYRTAYGNDAYIAWAADPGWTESHVGTSDTSGKLRLRRIGTTLYWDYWSGAAWNNLRTKTVNTGDWWIDLRVESATPNFPDITADFDNFLFNYGCPDEWLTTCPPTTLAPTTEEPTTLAPTTEPPTTVPPTTAPPTTVYPSTYPPTTEFQTTLGPSTKPPTTLGATTSPPTTAPPTTSAPTTSAPTSVAPTTPLPTTQAPTTQAPTSLAPTTSAPTTSPPTTEVPTTLAPTTAIPTTAAPTTVPVTTAAPSTIAPTTLPPTTAPATTLTTAAPTTVPPTTPAPTCAKSINSIITDEVTLLSLITDQVTLNSLICN